VSARPCTCKHNRSRRGNACHMRRGRWLSPASARAAITPGMVEHEAGDHNQTFALSGTHRS